MEKRLVDERKEEVINACEKLYQKLDFKDINIKLISSEISVGRTSIYNYFETKEEIFLALLEREYLKWNEDLVYLLKKEKLSKEDFINKITDSLLKRKILLKLISMNMFEMEANSRVESITNFKLAFKESISLLKECLYKFFNVKESEAEEITFTILPFLVGIYPYTSLTDKMKEAINKANLEYKFYTDKEMIKIGFTKILGGIIERNI